MSTLSPQGTCLQWQVASIWFDVTSEAVLGCGFAVAAPAAKAPSNVILVTIDTVRADHLGCYGAANVQTPTLDGLARDGVVFDRAISRSESPRRMRTRICRYWYISNLRLATASPGKRPGV